MEAVTGESNIRATRKGIQGIHLTAYENFSWKVLGSYGSQSMICQSQGTASILLNHSSVAACRRFDISIIIN